MQDSVQNSEISSPQFVHLRCHSEYSIVDGIVRIDDYITAASKDAMPAIALILSATAWAMSVLLKRATEFFAKEWPAG
jgi:DNA polymerase III alpha subunit